MSEASAPKQTITHEEALEALAEVVSNLFPRAEDIPDDQLADLNTIYEYIEQQQSKEGQ